MHDTNTSSPLTFLKRHRFSPRWVAIGGPLEVFIASGKGGRGGEKRGGGEGHSAVSKPLCLGLLFLAPFEESPLLCNLFDILRDSKSFRYHSRVAAPPVDNIYKQVSCFCFTSLLEKAHQRELCPLSGNLFLEMLMISTLYQ